MFFPDISNLTSYAGIVAFGIVLFVLAIFSGAYVVKKIGIDSRTGKIISAMIIVFSICSVVFGYAFAIQTQSASNLEKAITGWCNADANSVKACNTVCYMIGGIYEVTKSVGTQEKNNTIFGDGRLVDEQGRIILCDFNAVSCLACSFDPHRYPELTKACLENKQWKDHNFLNANRQETCSLCADGCNTCCCDADGTFCTETLMQCVTISDENFRVGELNE